MTGIDRRQHAEWVSRDRMEASKDPFAPEKRPKFRHRDQDDTYMLRRAIKGGFLIASTGLLTAYLMFENAYINLTQGQEAMYNNLDQLRNAAALNLIALLVLKGAEKLQQNK